MAELAAFNPHTGDPIVLQPGEQLMEIAWPGKRPVVVVRRGPDGAEQYRLAVPRCQTWNSAAGLPLKPWAPDAVHQTVGP